MGQGERGLAISDSTPTYTLIWGTDDEERWGMCVGQRQYQIRMCLGSSVFGRTWAGCTSHCNRRPVIRSTAHRFRKQAETTEPSSICPFCRWVYITTYFTWHIITSYRLIVNDPNAHCNRIPGIWCHSRRNHRSEPEWTNLSYYRRIEFKFFIVSTSRHQTPPGVGVGGGMGGLLCQVSDRDAQHHPSTRNATRVKKKKGGGGGVETIHLAQFWWKIGVKIRHFPHFC